MHFPQSAGQPKTVNKGRKPAMAVSAKIQSIYRYPVKGLIAREAAPRRPSPPAQTLPLDRIYAIENGPSGFDPAHPAYLPKQRFLMLMRNARLAELATALRRRRATSLTIRVREPRGRARRPAHRRGPRRDRAVLRGVLRRRTARAAEGAARAPATASPTSRKKVVSIINLASVAGSGERRRRAGQSAALPRQSPCRRLAGLARVRPGRLRDRDRAEARG